MTGHQNSLAKQVGEHLVCAELGRRGIIATPFAGNIPSFDILAANQAGKTVPIQVKAIRQSLRRGRSAISAAQIDYQVGDWQSDAKKWMNLDYDPNTRKQAFNGHMPLPHPDIIYVLVVFSDLDELTMDSRQHDQFFILTQQDLQTIIINGYRTWMDKHNWIRPRRPDSYHCAYTVEQVDEMKFRNNWKLITDRLNLAKPSPSIPAE